MKKWFDYNEDLEVYYDYESGEIIKVQARDSYIDITDYLSVDVMSGIFDRAYEARVEGVTRD